MDYASGPLKQMGALARSVELAFKQLTDQAQKSGNIMNKSLDISNVTKKATKQLVGMRSAVTDLSQSFVNLQNAFSEVTVTDQNQASGQSQDTLIIAPVVLESQKTFIVNAAVMHAAALGLAGAINMLSMAMMSLSANLAEQYSGLWRWEETGAGAVKTSVDFVSSLSTIIVNAVALSNAMSSLTTWMATYITRANIAAVAIRILTRAQGMLAFIFLNSPIGVTIGAVAILAKAIRIAYVHSATFRNICDKLWVILKKVAVMVADLAQKVWNLLVKAFNKCSDAIKAVWDGIKWLFGIDDTTTADAVKTTADAVEKLGESADNSAASIVDLFKTFTGFGAVNLKFPEYHLPSGVLEQAERFNTAVKKLERTPGGKNIGLNFDTSRPENLSPTAAAKGLAQDNIERHKQSLDELRSKLLSGAQAFAEYRKGWGALKNGAGAIKSVTTALEGQGTAWDKLVAVVDAALGLYDMITSIMSVVKTLTEASTAAQAIGIGVKKADTQASQENTTANVAEGASGVIAAHSKIPFVGIAIAGGMIAAMLALMAALPKFAQGGIAYGPTLGLFGEYAGAANNPEVVAPLSRLRSLIGDASPGMGGKVEFEIRGERLYGVLDRYKTRIARS